MVKGFRLLTHLPTIPTQIPQKRFENPTVKPAPNSLKPRKHNQTLKGIIHNRGTLVVLDAELHVSLQFALLWSVSPYFLSIDHFLY